jgi:hypothetical protein
MTYTTASSCIDDSAIFVATMTRRAPRGSGRNVSSCFELGMPARPMLGISLHLHTQMRQAPTVHNWCVGCRHRDASRAILQTQEESTCVARQAAYGSPQWRTHRHRGAWQRGDPHHGASPCPVMLAATHQCMHESRSGPSGRSGCLQAPQPSECLAQSARRKPHNLSWLPTERACLAVRSVLHRYQGQHQCL